MLSEGTFSVHIWVPLRCSTQKPICGLVFPLAKTVRSLLEVSVRHHKAMCSANPRILSSSSLRIPYPWMRDSYPHCYESCRYDHSDQLQVVGFPLWELCVYNRRVLSRTNIFLIETASSLRGISSHYVHGFNTRLNFYTINRSLIRFRRRERRRRNSVTKPRNFFATLVITPLQCFDVSW